MCFSTLSSTSKGGRCNRQRAVAMFFKISSIFFDIFSIFLSYFSFILSFRVWHRASEDGSKELPLIYSILSLYLTFCIIFPLAKINQFIKDLYLGIIFPRSASTSFIFVEQNLEKSFSSRERKSCSDDDFNRFAVLRNDQLASLNVQQAI